MKYRVDVGDIMDWPGDGLFHACLCDPPYELGFMGKRWDGSGVSFRPETWARIGEHLYPGAFLFAFAGSRTYHRIACAIEDAGFILHPMIGMVCGAGFPKATRIDTQIDRAAGAEREVMGVAPTSRPNTNVDEQVLNWGGHGHGKVQMLTVPATPLAASWAGHRYGLQSLKPALEPIICAQKPYAGKPVDSIVATGAGALWVDGARVAGTWERDSLTRCDMNGGRYIHGKSGGLPCEPQTCHPAGRWPPNFALSHLPECKRVGTKRVAASVGGVKGKSGFAQGYESGEYRRYAADADGLETVDAWDCAPGCPVAALDAEVGERPAGTAVRHRGVVAGMYGPAHPAGTPDMTYGDRGGPSRFFPRFDYALERLESLELPFKYTAKSSRRERDAGLGGWEAREAASTSNGGVPGRAMTVGAASLRGKAKSPSPQRNTHTTVKPLALTRWLATLLLPPPEYAPRRILVPFAGSGSECIGAGLAGWEEVVGVEMEAEYAEIARARLAHWLSQPVKDNLF